MDEQQRQNLFEDLKGLIKGDLLFDDLSRALYSTDASLFQIHPAGVVAPRDEEDVQTLVRFATENNLSLIARGAGSGVAGESLGAGIVVDMSRHFRSIVECGKNFIRVQPGVTCRAVADYLAPLGRCFAPDPASDVQCTIGGMIANNASGARLLRRGYTRDHVYKLRVVLDSGDALEVGREPVNAISPQHPPHLHDIIAAAAVLLEENTDAIKAGQPRTPFNRCGYLLHDVLEDDHLDLPRLLTGSEGTLAIITEATLKTIPLPAGRALVLCGFDSLDAAVGAVQHILPTSPSACELMDRRLLSLARGGDAHDAATLVPPAVEAVLLVEYETGTAEEAPWAAKRLPYLLSRKGHAVRQTIIALTSEEMERLWRLREAALPSLYGLRAGARPVPVVEDVGVPPDDLAMYLHRVQDILQEHETTASFLIHAGAGQVHTRPFLDLERPEERTKLAVLAEKIHTLALNFRGTISTQHGTGIARSPWVARQYPELYSLFRQLKAVFDPLGIFNPGKIVDAPSSIADWPLRRQLSPATNTGPAPSLHWQEQPWHTECLKCNGCGQCRIEAPSHRMCPIFHANPTEAATPRAKANLLWNVLAAEEEKMVLSADAVRDVADLCVHCKMCALECPARVNIPKLMLEVKAQHVAEHGMGRKDWFLARIENFARWGSTFALLVNIGLASRAVRWCLEKMFGLSRRRRLPRIAYRSFLQQARRRGLTAAPDSDRPRVAYFVDVFANYVDPSIALATVAVLEHNGIDVYVPPDQRGCGMSALVHGDVESARETAERNLLALAEAARQGYTIICSEPTAALMLRQDYLDLLPHTDAQLVAGQTWELTTYLWGLHERGKLRTDFKPLSLSVGHHIPCHLKALAAPPAGTRLLSLIPGLAVHEIDVSCSGMAGTFGLKDENYQTSLASGERMLREVQRPRVIFGATECSSCRLQMEEGAGKRTLHPAQFLALAYGLLPGLSQRLQEPFGELTLQ